MADLNGLFQNLGPTGGALMSGLQTGQDLVSAAQQDEMRKAQMEEILQRTAAQKELAPLELQAKQQAIAAADLKAKEDRAAYTMDVLGRAIPELKSVKGPQRFAEYEKIFARAGIPLDEEDRAHMYAKNPDTFLSELESRHKSYLTSRPAYQQAMDVAREHSRGQLAVENAREAAAITKAQAKIKSTEQVIAGMKKASEKEAGYRDLAVQAELLGNMGDAAKYKKLADTFQEQASRERTEQQQAAQAAAAKAQATQQMVNQYTGGSLGTGTYNIPVGTPVPAGGPRRPISEY